MKSHTKVIRVFFIIFLFGTVNNTYAQLAITPSSNYVQLVDSFIASGVTVSNISYSGSSSACGYFSNGNTTNLGTGSGIILSTGYVSTVNGGVAYSGNGNNGGSGNALLTLLTGGITYDAAVLEFDIVPAYDTLSFRFIYGSEDYPEFVGGNPLFQDYMGAFITGTNPSGGNYSNQNFAFVPNTNLPVIANNINDTANAQYFVNNTSGSVMFDGFTTLLEVKIPVLASASYHLTIAIADGGDYFSDAGIFLKSHSLISYGNKTGIAVPGKQEVFQFYPNPSEDNIILNTAGKGILTITNQLGQFVEGVPVTDNLTQISTDNLPSGIYFLTFQTGNITLTRMLVIQ